MGGLTPIILATNAAADKQVTTTAKADGAFGHYAAAITFPVAGEWQWQIQPFAEESQYVLALPGPLLVREAGASASSAAPAAAQFEVVADDSFFKVKDMQITEGATLKWTNVGKLPHTIKAVDGSFASGNLDHNAVYAFTFTKPGTYQYYCEYHGGPDGTGMFGILTVTAAAPKELPNTGTSGDMLPMLLVVGALVVAVGIVLRRRLVDAG
jgi:LPXTG-motif cell wall-anchored protein